MAEYLDKPYRSDSTIVLPYAKFIKSRDVYVNPGPYLEGRDHDIIWFVSNCNAVNKVRILFALEAYFKKSRQENLKTCLTLQ